VDGVPARNGRSRQLRRQIQVIPGVTQLSGFGECALLDKVLQVSCRRGSGRSGDADIFLCAQAAPEAVDAFAE
jgi:hypothetical protein